MDEVWERIGSLARLAPTPHNTQPFRIRPRGDRAELVLLTEHLEAALPRSRDESIRMIPDGRRPTLKVFRFGESPISGQDIRIKRRYIV